MQLVGMYGNSLPFQQLQSDRFGSPSPGVAVVLDFWGAPNTCVTEAADML